MALRLSRAPCRWLLDLLLGLLLGWPLGGLLLLKLPCALANQLILPNMGSSTAITLSVEQERLLGERYRRQLCGSQLLLTDPLLNHYLAELGQRLVAHADPVRMPLHFYWLNSHTLNAFAFLGGHVVLHTALLQVTESESELAAVMAHEISHVTQRHLARALEAQQCHGPIAWAGAVGSAMLMLVHPAAGTAALVSTLGGVQQQAISFTQANEQEADRIGIGVLTRAGFDPRASFTFLEKVAKASHDASNPPEILLTHPLPRRRLAEARDRVQQLAPQPVQGSLAYHLAKIRWQCLYAANTPQYRDSLSPVAPETLPDSLQAITTGYRQALLKYHNHQLSQSRAVLQPLLARYPENLWLIDLMTDVDVDQQRYGAAAQRLQQALNNRPDHPVLLLNLANVYLKQGTMLQAIDLLQRYCRQYPQDSNGWQLLATAYAAHGMVAEEQAAQAELLALQGHFQAASQALLHAIRLQKEQPLTVARHQARLAQLQELKRNRKNDR